MQTSTPQTSSNSDPFGESVLAPVKLTTQGGGRDSPKPPADAFGDLCELGTKSTDKTPKQLFAEKNTSPKKPMSELVKATQPTQQASFEDPFGTFDSFNLPEAGNFKTTPASNDPFDTSYVNNPSKAMQSQTMAFKNSTTSGDKWPVSSSKPDPWSSPKKPNDWGSFSEKANAWPMSPERSEGSDSDNFDMPSPEGPPPPLPPERKVDKIAAIPPAPPPRPALSAPHLQNSCDKLAPSLPPRNLPPESQSTSIKPVPRPRPQSKGQGDATLKESHSASSHSNSNDNTRKKVEENNNLSTAAEDKVSMNSSTSSCSSGQFVIEDPFQNSDPFADCDPFNSSNGFSKAFDNSFGDPFASAFSSQLKGQKSEHLDSKDDPFAAFDKNTSDTFNFKSNGVQKNMKVSPKPVVTNVSMLLFINY